jgi:hypothetical protein
LLAAVAQRSFPLRHCLWPVVAQAPDKATYIELGFEKGDPVSLDGVALSPAAMLTALNKVAGDNGIGRIDIVESRFVGEQRQATRSERKNLLAAVQPTEAAGVPCISFATADYGSTTAGQRHVTLVCAYTVHHT